MAYSVGFCVSGKGRLARAAIVNAKHIGINPGLLIADHNAENDLEHFCIEYGVTFIRIPKLPRSEFNQVLLNACTKKNLDLVCLTFDKILPTQLVNFFEGRMINVHPALLPAFVGTKALERAEFQGVRFAGATIHEVVEKVDAGSIVAQCIVSLDFMEKYENFGAKIYQHLEPMFLQAINWYATGRIYKDEFNRIWVRDAVYGSLPISPALELNLVSFQKE